MVPGSGKPGRAAGITAPFQMVALDDDGPGNLAASPALPLRPGVDEDRAVLHGPERRRGAELHQAGPGLGQQVINGVRGCVH